MDKKHLKLINRALLILLLIVLGWTYFAKDNYRAVDKIHPDILKEPIQVELVNQAPITFSRDGFNYELSPLADYEVNGLVVNQRDYRNFTLSKVDEVYPLDVCLIWGKNVSSKVYQNPNLTFSQDSRFAYWSYTGDVNFSQIQAANEHLIVNDDYIASKLKEISTGDQVKIRGQLVSVKAKNTGEVDIENPEELTMKSSTTRDDTGAGACEIIYVTSADILEKGNSVAYFLYKISFYMLIILILGKLAWFIYKGFSGHRSSARKIQDQVIIPNRFTG
ncbi:MAG: hypothetical protein C4562_04525 [Actinobacteria bacterium]|nr:MAG: hypothetical protein C4562_04525 [Actinomycetota bacterium]